MWRLDFATAIGDHFVGSFEADIQTLTRYLGKPGALEATIAVTNDEIGAEIQEIIGGEGRLTVYAYNGGKMMWGGLLDDTSVAATDAGTVLHIGGATFEAYPDRREARINGKFTGLEQTEYIRKLWDYMQGTFGGNLGIETDFAPMTTRARDYKWLRSEARKVGEIMADICNNIDGFEWAIDCFDDGTRRRRVLRVGHPQLKRPSLPLVLNFPGNVVTYSVETDAAQGATAFQARGMSEKQAQDLLDEPEEWGKWAPIDRTLPSWMDEKTWQEWADLLEAGDLENEPLMSSEHFATDLLNAGYVRTDATVERQDTGTVTGLNAWAKKAVQMRGGPLVIPSILTFLSEFDQAMIGSYAKLQITDTAYPAKADGSPGYQGSARCIGYEVTPATFGSIDMVKLVFEDPFSRSMQTQARHRKTLSDVINDTQSAAYDAKTASSYVGNGYGGSAGKIGTIANPWGGPGAARVILNGSTEAEAATFNYSDHLSLASGDKVLLGEFEGQLFITTRFREGHEGDWVATNLFLSDPFLDQSTMLTVQGPDGQIFGCQHARQKVRHDYPLPGQPGAIASVGALPPLEGNGFVIYGAKLGLDGSVSTPETFTPMLWSGLTSKMLQVGSGVFTRPPAAVPKPAYPDADGSFYISEVQIITGLQEQSENAGDQASQMFTAAGHVYLPVEIIVRWDRNNSVAFPYVNDFDHERYQQAMFLLRSKILPGGELGELEVVPNFVISNASLYGSHAAATENSVMFYTLFCPGWDYLIPSRVTVYEYERGAPVSCTFDPTTGDLVGDVRSLPTLPFGGDQQDQTDHGFFLAASMNSFGRSIFTLDVTNQALLELEVDEDLRPRNIEPEWRVGLDLTSLPFVGTWYNLVSSHRDRIIAAAPDFKDGYFVLEPHSASPIDAREFQGPPWHPGDNKRPEEFIGIGHFSYGDRSFAVGVMPTRDPQTGMWTGGGVRCGSRRLYRLTDPGVDSYGYTD